MKRIILKTLLVVFILILTVSIYSLIQIKHEAPVTYVKNIPSSIMAMTIPPFGIFIEEKYIEEGDEKGSILGHERIHWLQYQERGIFGFYSAYISGWIKHGRLYNELEYDARNRN